MSDILSRIMPKATLIFTIVVAILVMSDYFIAGGLGGTAMGGWNITTLQAMQTRSGPVHALIMVFAILQLYFRRLKGKDAALKRKALLFFVGFAFVFAAGLIWSPLSMQYSFMSRLLVQATTESGTFWIGIVYVVAIVKGYMIRSWEGIVLSIPGILELWGQGGIGNVFLPQLGDAGMWIMRYPSVGGNIAIALARNVATLAIAARVLTGRQKLRAAR